MSIDEETLAYLVKRGVEIESIIADVLFQLLIVEEDEGRRKLIYELLRDTERHKAIQIRISRMFSEELTPLLLKEEHRFREMFTTQRMGILKDYVVVVKDFYRFLIEDIKQAAHEKRLDLGKVEKILPALEGMLGEKEEQLKRIEKLVGKF